MSSEFSYLPALIGPDSPTYFLVDHSGQAHRVADMATDERTRRAEQRRRDRLSNEAIIRELDARESVVNQYPYTVAPVTHRRVVMRPFKINGVNVMIRGDEPSIRSVVNVLQTYPPSGPTFITDTEEDKFYDLTGPLCEDGSGGIDARGVGMKPYGDGSHIVAIFPDGSEFSGAGTLLFLTTKTADELKASANLHSEIYVPLFHETDSGQYSSLGGRISKPDADDLNKNILYVTALKETEEESADLIKIGSDTQDNDGARLYADIDAGSDTKYRSYPYFGMSPVTLGEIENRYNQNTQAVRRIPGYTDSYRETDDIRLFRLDQLIAQMDAVVAGTDISRLASANLTDRRGNVTQVRGRTVRVLAKLFERTNGNREVLNSIVDPDKLKTINENTGAGGVQNLSF
jgi:hypothetical protein